MLLGSLVKVLNKITPPELAEDWDNVGFQMGDPNWEVYRVLCVLDVTTETVREAVEKKAELLLAHHPVVFRPVRSVVRYGEGDLLFQLMEKRLALYVAHTNLDVLRGGVADTLARELELEKVKPLLPREVEWCHFQILFSQWGKRHSQFVEEAVKRHWLKWKKENKEQGKFLLEGVARREFLEGLPRGGWEIRFQPSWKEKGEVGLGRVGLLPKSLWAKEFLLKLKRILQASRIRFVGHLRRKIRRVALLPGSGGDLIGRVAQMGVDVYVTGDVKHHQALLAKEKQLFVVDGGHFLTERLVLAQWAKMVKQACPEVEVLLSETWTDPFQYI